MPSVSKKQHNFMAAVANNPKFAKKVGIPRSVGEEFLTADKGKKFKEGGTMKNTARMNKLEELGRVDSEKAYTPKGKMNLAAEKKRVVGELKYAKGGHTDIAKDKPMMKKVAKAEVKAHEKSMHGMKSGGMAYSKGGQLSKADGCAVKGKSKGTMIKMKNGGAC
jgi:hypothetical protein